MLRTSLSVLTFMGPNNMTINRSGWVTDKVVNVQTPLLLHALLVCVCEVTLGDDMRVSRNADTCITFLVFDLCQLLLASAWFLLVNISNTWFAHLYFPYKYWAWVGFILLSNCAFTNLHIGRYTDTRCTVNVFNQWFRALFIKCINHFFQF